MERLSARVGAAPKELFQVRSETGAEVDPSSVVFAILKHSPALVQVIGTGFYIGHHGLFATAKHVLQECLDAKGEPSIPLTIVHRIPETNRVVFRPIVRVFLHNGSDVAVGMGGEMRHDQTGETLWSNSVVLSSRPINRGHAVTTYAYPNATTELAENDRQNVHLFPLFYSGEVVESFPAGRDRIMMPGPCFQTTIHLHGGASGGPVFEADTGQVCGINSTSFGDAPDVSFVSMVRGLLNIDIDGVVIPPETHDQTMKLSRLIELGLIPFK